MAKAKNPIPEGLHGITPNLIMKGAAQAMEFYKKAFNAKELSRMEWPGGAIAHAEMRIGDSTFFLSDEFPGQPENIQRCVAPTTLKGTTNVLHLYVTDCDQLYKQAVSAGAKPSMPLEDQFWGDRYGQVTDPYGHVWAIATHKEDLTKEEMEERGKKFMASMANQH